MGKKHKNECEHCLKKKNLKICELCYDFYCNKHGKEGICVHCHICESCTEFTERKNLSRCESCAEMCCNYCKKNGYCKKCRKKEKKNIKRMCTRCGQKKKIKNTKQCRECKDYFCKKCFKEENNKGLCYDCHKIKKLEKLHTSVNQLLEKITIIQNYRKTVPID